MNSRPLIWLSALLMSISSVAYAGGDSGLTWQIPNTDDGGAAANPGADWFNADTSISYRVPFAAPAEHDDGKDLFDVSAFNVGATNSPTAATPNSFNGYLQPTAPQLALDTFTSQAAAVSDFGARHDLTKVTEGYSSLKVINTSVVASPIASVTGSYQAVDLKDEFAESKRVAGDTVLKDMKPPTDIVNTFNFK